MKAEMTQFSHQWLFVNMPITNEDKILIKNLFVFKGYNAKKLLLVRVSQQTLESRQVVAKATDYWVGLPSSSGSR